MNERVCRVCGEPIVGRDRRAIYCSVTCNQRARDRMRHDRELDARRAARAAQRCPCDNPLQLLARKKLAHSRFCDDCRTQQHRQQHRNWVERMKAQGWKQTPTRVHRIKRTERVADAEFLRIREIERQRVRRILERGAGARYQAPLMHPWTH